MPGPPANLRAYVGTRAQRSTTPPAPLPSPCPLCTAVPSRTSRPSGFAQRRRYLRIVLTDSAPAPAGLPFAEAKKKPTTNEQNKTKKTNRRNKATRPGPKRPPPAAGAPGLVSLPTCPVAAAVAPVPCRPWRRGLPRPECSTSPARHSGSGMPRVADGLCWWPCRWRVRVGKCTWVSFLLF